jgi:hypothetical protein
MTNKNKFQILSLCMFLPHLIESLPVPRVVLLEGGDVGLFQKRGLPLGIFAPVSLFARQDDIFSRVPVKIGSVSSPVRLGVRYFKKTSDILSASFRQLIKVDLSHLFHSNPLAVKFKMCGKIRLEIFSNLRPGIIQWGIYVLWNEEYSTRIFILKSLKKDACTRQTIFPDLKFHRKSKKVEVLTGDVRGNRNFKGVNIFGEIIRYLPNVCKCFNRICCFLRHEFCFIFLDTCFQNA